MISRMIEQKKALVGYDSEYGLPVHLLNSEWIIAENLLRMLELFQRTTKEFSHNSSSVSQVIPFIEILKLELENQESGSVVQAAKEITAKNWQAGFSQHILTEHTLSLPCWIQDSKQNFWMRLL